MTSAVPGTLRRRCIFTVRNRTAFKLRGESMDMIMDGVQNFVAARSLLELYGGLAAGLLLLS